MRPRGAAHRGSGPARPGASKPDRTIRTRSRRPGMVRFGWGGTSILDEPLDLDWGYLRDRHRDERRDPDPARPAHRRLGLDQRPDLPARPARGHRATGRRSRAPAWTGRRWTRRIAPSRPRDRRVSGSGAGRARRGSPRRRPSSDACIAAGYGALDDHNAPDAMGAGGLPFNQDDRVRWSPPLAYLTAAGPGPAQPRDPAEHVRPADRVPQRPGDRGHRRRPGRHDRRGARSPRARSSSRPGRSAVPIS